MSTITTVTCQKGGVAKSQTAIETGFYLAQNGKKVLLLDLDPQATTTNTLLAESDPRGRLISEVLVQEIPRLMPNDIMTRTFSTGISIDYACSSIKSTGIEARITAIPKEFIIADALRDIRDSYDHIIIDTSPSVELLTRSALIASDDVLIPVNAGRSSIESIADTMKLVEVIQKNERLNPTLRVKGILVTRTKLTNIIGIGIKQLRKNYGDLVLDVTIRECTRVQQAEASYRPVLDYDPSCQAAKDYAKALSILF